MEKEYNRKKSGIVIRIVDYVLLALMIAIAVVLFIKVGSMRIFPNLYMILGSSCIFLLALGVFFSSFRKIPGIIMAVVAFIVCGVMIYGFFVVSKVDKTIETISVSSSVSVVQMSVVVKEDCSAEVLDDLKGKRIGYIPVEEEIDALMEQVNANVSSPVIYVEYEDNVLLLADALLNDEVDAILINAAFIDVIDEMDGYIGFASKVKVLHTLEVEVEIEVPVVETTEDDNTTEETITLNSDEDVMVVYITGIDMWGAVNSRSRSDVNLLAIINTKSGHIQIINTPRDYYVYLPNQGAMDKLTHAGLYGVESSEAALENLYGIKIDYYLRMNFTGFEKIIDTLHGVDVYSEYDFTVYPVKHYVVGYNHLTGIEALAFARERHAFATGDVQRGNNQMEVVKAVINKITSPSILTTYNQVLDEVSDCLMTDVPSDVIYDLVRYQLDKDISWKVDSYTVTGRGSSNTTYSMPNTTCYVMIPNDDEVAEAKRLIEAVMSEE